MKKQNPYKRSCNYKKTSKTLDFCHKHNIEFFETKRDSLDEKYSLLETLNTELLIITIKPNMEKSDEDFVNLVLLNDKIKATERLIHNIMSNKEELDYYANTADILYNYYDLVENNSDNNMNIKEHITNNNTNNKKKSILEYFHNSQPTEETVIPDTKEEVDVTIQPTVSFNSDNNRASLLDQYLSITDKNYINDNIDNNIALKCEHCHSMDKTILQNDSISVCNECFSVQHLLTDNEKPSYKDPPKEISYFSYKRINHYQEWLNQIQGKETTDIPEEVFDKIMLELKKQRINNIKEINRSKIKEILKKLKINKYYEHIPYILNRITGIPNPNLTPELEEKLRNMFKEIQVPFLKHSPLVRKNFLSYSYVIHKFIQILGKEEYLKYFPLLKSREKLHQQEEIWKKICKDLGWKFFRSI
ncbi:hypothetical protein QKU58_gp018 [Pyramimonas orientalis virus]|uniref:Uncharacterized protein n=1 Tax=Pyramimonas orientalis virus 01B TaxID=3134525 RepID=A0A7M4CEQ2_9VIRU|nr:hypothetical protein QKU58_gp018 [Pyramimonas orientalis virus]QOI90156.1 hypothetical protein HWQ62_00018 [Pyramimonas orientalis virus]